MSVIWSGVTEEGAVVPVQVTAEGKVVAVGDGPEGEYLKLTGGNLTGDLTLGTDDKITLDAADGSASYADKVTVGEEITSNLDANVGVTIAPGGSIRAQRSGAGVLWSGKQTNVLASTSQINADGSASFAGDVTTQHVQSGLTANGTVGNHGFFLSGSGGNTFTSRIRRNTTGNAAVLAVDSKNVPNAIVLNADGSATFSGDKCGFTSAGELIFTSRNARYKLVVSDGFLFPEPYTREMELKEKAEQFIAGKRETKPSQPEVTPDNDNA